MTAERFIGLISGTSMDGIDTAAVDFSGGRPELRAAETVPYDASLRAELDELRADPDAFPAARLARLDASVGEAFAFAACRLLDKARWQPDRVRALGSHGQTVLHRPDDDPPHTLQIGDPTRIATATGIDVVADFRRADLAAGGQGAPLAPLLHAALLGEPGRTRAVVNLGGIANATVIDGERAVAGFDTGPANCFLDHWFRVHRDHRHDDRYDAGGRWAGCGRIDPSLLERLMGDAYFDKPPPKSTGIEYFSTGWLRARVPADARPVDVQATLAEFSAATLVDALVPFRPDRVLLCGGGTANDDLVERIRRRLGTTPVHSTAEYGIDPEFVEATLMAWLAREFTAGRQVDTRSITGAARPVRLGALWPGQRRAES